MSLSGSLSALSLAELLQIVAMSRKTGALEICAERGVAWLGVHDGGIVRVALENGALERDKVLERAGLTPSSPPELIEATLWDAAVHALLKILEWDQGDFTFEPLEDMESHWRGPAGVVLPAALSPEFLALEGARLEDENVVLPSLPRLRGGGPVPEPAGGEEAAAFPAGELPDAVEVSLPLEPEALEVVELEALPLAPLPPMICVDRDLRLLEQIKAEFGARLPQVHIFQEGSAALERLKHYVLRGEFPVFVLGSEVVDPLDGRRGEGWGRFVERVRSLVPGIRVAVIGVGSAPPNPIGDAVGWVERPSQSATAEQASAFLAKLARALGVEA
jgi:hypothetical protein